MDEEDSLQIKAVSEAIAKTILIAYKNRFPRFDQRDRCIMCNSLLLVICSFLNSLNCYERAIAIELITGTIKDLNDFDIHQNIY